MKSKMFFLKKILREDQDGGGFFANFPEPGRLDRGFILIKVIDFYIKILERVGRTAG